MQSEYIIKKSRKERQQWQVYKNVEGREEREAELKRKEIQETVKITVILTGDLNTGVIGK